MKTAKNNQTTKTTKLPFKQGQNVRVLNHFGLRRQVCKVYGAVETIHGRPRVTVWCKDGLRVRVNPKDCVAV